MHRNTIFGLLILVLLFSKNVFADSWISAGLPTGYTFSGEGNSLFSSTSKLSGTPSGTIFMASLPYLPTLGYEKYQIAIESDNSDEITAIIDVEFYDIAVSFDQKFASFLLGYGYGSMELQCEDTSVCGTISAEKGIARQYFGQLGVLLFGNLFFYLSGHRTMAENKLESGSTSEQLTLDGVMYSWGLKFTWD